MKLRLLRRKPDRFIVRPVTLGDLYVDGAWHCFTLEDQDRRLEAGGKKLTGQTAIPLGIYPVVIDMSQRFGRLMLHVLNVPQFDGVRIHAGNTTADTAGCILVGQDIDRDVLQRSRAALNELQPEVQAALDRGEPVSLTIERE